MRRTDKRLTEKECRELLTAIVKMVIVAYGSPPRKGFERSSRMAQCGYDLISILRNNAVIESGEQNQQERMDV